MRTRLRLGLLAASALMLQAQSKSQPDAAAFQAALDRARPIVRAWIDRQSPHRAGAAGVFQIDWGSPLFTGAWGIEVEGTRIRYWDADPLDPATQLALMQLARPDAPVEPLMNQIVSATWDTTLRKLRVEGASVIGLPKGAAGADDPKLDDLFWALRASPIPLGRALGDPSNEGYTFSVSDGWLRDPVLVFNTHEMPDGSERDPTWSRLHKAAWAFRNELWSRWEARLKQDHFKAILEQIVSMPIQGPAWFDAAIRYGWTELARELLARGLNPRSMGPDGTVPLVSACGTKDGAFFDELVKTWGSPVKLSCKSGEGPLCRSVAISSTHNTARLLALGADPNEACQVMSATGEDLGSPLAAAVASGHPALVDLLIQAGARPSPEIWKLAISRGDRRILRSLRHVKVGRTTR